MEELSGLSYSSPCHASDGSCFSVEELGITAGIKNASPEVFVTNPKTSDNVCNPPVCFDFKRAKDAGSSTETLVDSDSSDVLKKLVFFDDLCGFPGSRDNPSTYRNSSDVSEKISITSISDYLCTGFNELDRNNHQGVLNNGMEQPVESTTVAESEVSKSLDGFCVLDCGFNNCESIIKEPESLKMFISAYDDNTELVALDITRSSLHNSKSSTSEVSCSVNDYRVVRDSSLVCMPSNSSLLTNNSKDETENSAVPSHIDENNYIGGLFVQGKSSTKFELSSGCKNSTLSSELVINEKGDHINIVRSNIKNSKIFPSQNIYSSIEDDLRDLCENPQAPENFSRFIEYDNKNINYSICDQQNKMDDLLDYFSHSSPCDYLKNAPDLRMSQLKVEGIPKVDLSLDCIDKATRLNDITDKNVKSVPNIFNQAKTSHSESEKTATKPLFNVLNLVVEDGKWEIVNCHNSTDVFILKCLERNNEHNIHYIYFNKGTKLYELFSNRQKDELNVSREEIFNCIDSVNIHESSIDKSFRLSDEVEQDGGHIGSESTGKKSVFSEKNAENHEIRKSARSCGKSQLNAYRNSSENKVAGSKVEDISVSFTDITSEKTRSHVSNFYRAFLSVCIVLKMFFYFVVDTIYSIFTSIARLARPQPSTACVMTQTSHIADNQPANNTANESSDTTDDALKQQIENTDYRTNVENFYTLFKHLGAMAGTDVTADQVKKDINEQVVMDLYHGFQEMRTVDYTSLDLISKLIGDNIGNLRGTLLKSDALAKRSSVLLREESTNLEDKQKLNKDLKDLALDAEEHLNDIDSALSRIEDFTEEFVCFKQSLHKELADFLLEDFPEIFK